MKVLFAGSPDVALPTLRALQESDHTVVGVLTQPPAPVGRKQVMVHTAVGVFAAEQGLAVRTPRTSAEVQGAVEELSPDVAIVVAYGRILDAEQLESVPGGWWNVHFSLLPRWRGAAPVQHAILAGDTETGVTLFRIVEELDSGPVMAAVAHPVNPYDTSGTLLQKLSLVAPELVLDFLDQGDPALAAPTEQMGEPSFAHKFPPGFGHLDLRMDVGEVYQHFRAVTPEPGAYLIRQDTGAVVKVVSGWVDPDFHPLEPGELLKAPVGILVGTGSVPFVLERVHPAGKKPMAAEDWFRGLPEGVRIDVART
jgi:methionyl-tRNA formyltransferase